MIEITPETERLFREEISNDHFRSVDEIIRAEVGALREKNSLKCLMQFFPESPLVGCLTARAFALAIQANVRWARIHRGSMVTNRHGYGGITVGIEGVTLAVLPRLRLHLYRRAQKAPSAASQTTPLLNLSVAINFNYGVCKRAGRFLRQIVPHALDDLMRPSARELQRV